LAKRPPRRCGHPSEKKEKPCVIRRAAGYGALRQQQLLLHPHPLSQPPQPLLHPPQPLFPQLFPHPPQVKRRIRMIIQMQQLLFPKNMIFTSRE
jgi:hypothetical protein